MDENRTDKIVFILVFDESITSGFSSLNIIDHRNTFDRSIHFKLFSEFLFVGVIALDVIYNQNKYKSANKQGL